MMRLIFQTSFRPVILGYYHKRSLKTLGKGDHLTDRLDSDYQLTKLRLIFDCDIKGSLVKLATSSRE